MAKKVTGFLKLQVPAGAANPSPPIGPALGQRGLNIMEFCKAFNAQTQKIEKNTPIPVIITTYQDRSFTFELKTPPVSYFLKKAAKLDSGSKTPGREPMSANPPNPRHAQRVPGHIDKEAFGRIRQAAYTLPQVVKPEIRNAGFVDRRMPCAVGHLPRNRLTAIRKAEHRMLAPLSFQHFNCVSIQRNASRRAILGLVQPAVLRFRSTRSHSKPVISRARQPVANAKRISAFKCGAAAATRRSASSCVNQRSRSFSPDNKRIFGITSIHCHSSRAMRNKLRMVAR